MIEDSEENLNYLQNTFDIHNEEEESKLSNEDINYDILDFLILKTDNTDLIKLILYNDVSYVPDNSIPLIVTATGMGSDEIVNLLVNHTNTTQELLDTILLTSAKENNFFVYDWITNVAIFSPLTLEN